MFGRSKKVWKTRDGRIIQNTDAERLRMMERTRQIDLRVAQIMQQNILAKEGLCSKSCGE